MGTKASYRRENAFGLNFKKLMPPFPNLRAVSFLPLFHRESRRGCNTWMFRYSLSPSHSILKKGIPPK